MLSKFLLKIEKTETCWIWKTNINEKGYGRCWYNGSTRQAHRVIYELIRGKIPDNLELDHLCRNHACVNPEHLEPVSHHENVLRGNVGLLRKSQICCHKGHPLSGDNLYVYKNMRHCRECTRFNKKQFRLRKKLDKSS